MRVLHINLEPGWRGGERQTLNLMSGLRDLGYDNRLLTRQKSPLGSKCREQGFVVREISKPYLAYGRHMRGFDCIQTHEVRGLQLAAAWKPLLRSPLVYTRRVDFIPSRHWFTRYKYRQADTVVAISEKIRTVLLEWGLRADRCRHIPSGISFEPKARSGRVRELQQRFAGRTVVGCIASLVEHKDPLNLIRAAERIRHSRPDVCVVLVGEGPLRPDLEKTIRELRLDNVVLEGYQDDPYSYFGIFDCFVMASRQEGLCSSILDAFWQEVPVVATSAGGIPELVVDQETGLLARPEDPQDLARALESMLGNKELQDRCVRRAREVLEERFSLQTMARAYAAIYERLCSAPKPAQPASR